MRNPERVSLRPLLGGLILLLALTVIGATRFNSAEQREILDRTGSQLSAYTSTAAAMVTVWTGVQRMLWRRWPATTCCVCWRRR